MPLADFWRGRRVFLTGHTGFKGTWLALWLQMLGAEVTGYALAPDTLPAMFGLTQAGDGMHSVLGDVRELAQLQGAMQDSAPEVVLHMAAQPLVRRSYADPVGTYATNVMGTVHLLEAVRQTPSVRAVVVVTTDKVYDNREWVWSYREDEALGGFDPYSNSKACAELVTRSFRDSFFSPGAYVKHGVAVASARAGNVIGGGDWSADRLVPDFVRAADTGATLELRNPGAIRPWQHVLEPLAGYLRLAQMLVESGPAVSGSWNFGPSEQDIRSVGDVISGLAAQWPTPVEVRLAGDAAGPHEAHILKLDSSKARALLGWTPRWPLSHALASTVAWYGAHQRGDNMRIATEQQIASYAATTI